MCYVHVSMSSLTKSYWLNHCPIHIHCTCFLRSRVAKIAASSDLCGTSASTSVVQSPAAPGEGGREGARGGHAEQSSISDNFGHCWFHLGYCFTLRLTWTYSLSSCGSWSVMAYSNANWNSIYFHGDNRCYTDFAWVHVQYVTIFSMEIDAIPICVWVTCTM